MDQLNVRYSIRQLSRVLGFRRQTYYRRKQGHRPEVVDAQIVQLLREVIGTYLAWGFWMVFHYLRRQGYGWNHKKVYRIWKAEGLHLRKVPKRAKIKRIFQDLLAPEKINQGWAMDFLSDWVVGVEKQSVRLINIIDECSRKALWTEAHRSISAKKLTKILDQVIEWRGKPAYIRCDNGPEFISQELEKWAQQNQIELRFTQPGKPTQNGLIERLNGTLRTECLNLEWFENIDQLNDSLQQWWKVYNSIRPHSSIGYKTPDEFEKLNKNFYFQVVAA
jgi:putative transposase